MKEIKFRAWDKKENLYWMPGEETFCGRLLIQLNGEIFSRCCFDLIKANDEEFIIEQYIGIKDKKGIGIYEGDIVFYGRHGVIEFDGGMFGINWDYGINEKTMLGGLGNRTNLRSLNDGILDDTCVVGNIHQNKELLNV